jgi:hypothetical protein
MLNLEIGRRVQIVSSLPGFHLRSGSIVSVAHSLITRNIEDALRELRLYEVRLDNGRRFRFRGQDLVPLGMRRLHGLS